MKNVCGYTSNMNDETVLEYNKHRINMLEDKAHRTSFQEVELSIRKDFQRTIALLESQAEVDAFIDVLNRTLCDDTKREIERYLEENN